jgi:hypothetical protein
MSNTPTVDEARRAREKLDEIKTLLKTNQISYDLAKKEALPHLQTLNAYVQKRAKDFRLKKSLIIFTNYMK